jgi:hypothetical protein
MFSPGTPILDLAMAGGIIVVFVLTIQYAGLLSAIVALFTHFVLLSAPITTDLSSWRAPLGLWDLAVVVGLGVGAAYYAAKAREVSASFARVR